MSSLISYIFAQRWAMKAEVLRDGVALIERHARGERVATEMVAALVDGREATRAERQGSRPWDGLLGSASAEDQKSGYTVRDTPSGGVALVPLEGVISKYASMVNGASQARGTSSEAFIGSMDRAALDTRAKGIVIVCDSPGGTVAGTEEMAMAVAEARQQKKVIAWVAGMADSAAYWIASQADKIVLLGSAEAGNIGVFQVIRDTSIAAAAEGVKVHVVKKGEFKGIGVAGVPVTEGQLAVVEEELAVLYGQFVREAARGRGMSEKAMLHLADGRAHIGQDAVDNGLADMVGPLKAAIQLALA